MFQAERQLRFLVDLANVQLEDATDGAMRRLRGQLTEFAEGGFQDVTRGVLLSSGLVGPRTETYPLQAFRELQEGVRVLLRGLLELRERGWTGGVPVELGAMTFRPIPVHGTGHAALYVRGAVRDFVLLRALLVLSREPTSRIQQCPEATCGHRLFYRVRRQRFCSGTCTDRAIKRAERATAAGRRHEALRQRARYLRAVMDRLGPGAARRLEKKRASR